MSTVRPRAPRGSMSARATSFTLALAVLASLGLIAGAAQAEGEDCPTWFPDLQCDREARFDNTYMPMSMPYIFEDPFITTGANLVGIWHRSRENGAFQPTDVGVMALQLRVALTDKLALIATKDGLTFMDHDTKVRDIGGGADRRAVLKDDVGFMNMTLGFKYAMIVDEENRFILSPAIRYEIPLGNDEVFQGRGDGIFIPSASFLWGPVDNLNLIGGMGGNVPVDSKKESTSLFYNMHIQYVLAEMFVPFMELSGMHWTNSGNGGLKLNTSHITGTDANLSGAQALLRTGPFEGAEVANLGSEGIKGENLVMLGWGFRVPVTDQLVFGLSYERAVAGREHFTDQRLTAMATFEY